MHELSIAQNILEIVQQNLPADSSPAVRLVKLKVGELAGVDAESLEFCFSAVTEGTPLQGASLGIERIPVRCHCRCCGHDFHVEQFVFLCPTCESPDTEMISGRELQVVEIELNNA